MVEQIIITSIILSFLSTFLVLPFWINAVKRAGLTGKDMNKFSKNKIPELGGVGVLFGFITGVLFYIAINTFYFHEVNGNITKVFAILSVILLISLVGFVDDILGWKIGLNKKTRIAVILFSSVPLIAINSGQSEVLIPILGRVNLGLFYPLVLVPIGVLGSSVTYNFLAGYNGLEASQGILILTALSIVAALTGGGWLSLIGMYMVFPLIAFYLFNRYPSKIFPGDVMTYPIGAMIAIMAILGNMERIAIFFFIPYIIETGLKISGKLKKESFAKPNKDGTLEIPYEKFYGLEHISIYLLKKIKGKALEKEVVYLINLFQIAVIAAGFFIFRRTIF